jgi:hypothetical protein
VDVTFNFTSNYGKSPSTTGVGRAAPKNWHLNKFGVELSNHISRWHSRVVINFQCNAVDAPQSAFVFTLYVFCVRRLFMNEIAVIIILCLQFRNVCSRYWFFFFNCSTTKNPFQNDYPYIVLTVNFYLFGCAQLILTMHLQSVPMSGAIEKSWQKTTFANLLFECNL